jgi:hypothetical protein
LVLYDSTDGAVPRFQFYLFTGNCIYDNEVHYVHYIGILYINDQ